MRLTGVRRFTAVFVFTVLTLALATAAPALVIDDFADTAGSTLSTGIKQSTVGSKTVVDGPGLLGVIGGVRQVTLTATVTDLPGAEAVTVRVVRAGSLLSYGSSLGAAGQLQLAYDAGGAGLAANLSSATGLGVDIVTTDAAAMPCSVALTLSDGLRSVTLTKKATVNAAQTVSFSFIDRFSPVRTVNLRSIRSISLTLNPGKSGDLEIGGIRTIGGS
jgi:hypothetical protein